MNDIAKQNIKERLDRALEKEKLSSGEAALKLGVTPNVICCARNPKYWGNFSDAKWNAILNWVNSGQTLREYGEKHGKVVVEKKPESVVTKEAVPVPEKAVSVPKTHIPVPKEKVWEPKPAPRLSKGGLIELLIEEKELLQTKIDAIDVLLKHYIS